MNMDKPTAWVTVVSVICITVVLCFVAWCVLEGGKSNDQTIRERQAQEQEMARAGFHQAREGEWVK